MPNSILWIGLVVLWLFVLFPMLTDRHPKVRRQSDAALATRILSRSGLSRRFARGPASGHDSDPDWQPEEPVFEPAVEPEPAPKAKVEKVAKVERVAEVDAEVVDAELVSEEGDADEAAAVAEPVEVSESDEEAKPAARKSELVRVAAEETPAEDSADEVKAAEGPVRRGRGRFDPEADAVARASRYAFRQRTILALVLLTLVSAAVAFFAFTPAWWACGGFGVLAVLYLGYLRRQVQVEAEIRRRRLARLKRSRIEVAEEQRFRYEQRSEQRANQREVVRRSGAVVLEIDDEDPRFAHLPSADEVMYGRRREYEPVVRRAVGQ